jgi:hypothetical protein
MRSGSGLVRFLLVSNSILAQKRQSEAKLISYSESVLKIASIQTTFEFFWNYSFFSGKISFLLSHRVLRKSYLFCAMKCLRLENSSTSEMAVEKIRKSPFREKSFFRGRWGVVGGPFFTEKRIVSKIFEWYMNRRSFNADSEYDIRLVKIVQKQTPTVLNRGMFALINGFWLCKIGSLVAVENGY